MSSFLKDSSGRGEDARHSGRRCWKSEPTLAVVSKLSGSKSLSSNWGVQGQALHPGEGMCKNRAGARAHRYEFH